MFDSRIDGLFIISENNAEPEITIRDLVTYLSCNDIRCFRKIYIKCKNISPEKTEICRKICSDYPVLELYEK